MRYLIVNADDYGMTPGVSAGIRQASAGVVRSTTAMGNLLTKSDAEALGDCRLAVGAHLNLSYGRPLSPDYPARLLNAEGCFIKALALDAATWEDPQAAELAVAEWRSQLGRLGSLGLKLTHIDSHHHTHMLPGLWPRAQKLAQELGLGIRSRAEGNQAAREAGLFTPDYFSEGYFGNNSIGSGALLAQLDAAQAQTKEGATIELMCHPGLADEVLRRDSTYTEERETELSVLGAADLEQLLKERGWLLRDYRQS